MTVTQVYGIVNSLANQMKGSEVTVTNAQNLIDLGESVLSSSENKDIFLSTLVDRIGRTIISQRAYSSQVANLINDSFTFGAILQKIYVQPIEATTSDQWSLSSGDTVDQYVIAPPTVKQKLFSTRTTWEVDITIPDFQLQTAFEGPSQMAAFIDAIFLAVRNSQEVYLAGMAELCYCNMIGERLLYKSTNSSSKVVINLLDEYNTLTSSSLDESKALYDVSFLQYASYMINLYVKRLSKMSTQYNSEEYARFTPVENLRVVLLADFTTASSAYLQSNTYHSEMVALPGYIEVPYWQSAASPAEININVASDGTAVNQTGVLGLLCDVEALGLTYDNRRSRSAYNAKGEYTNFFEKADMGYFNDLSENAIIFVAADSLYSTSTTST